MLSISCVNEKEFTREYDNRVFKIVINWTKIPTEIFYFFIEFILDRLDNFIQTGQRPCLMKVKTGFSS